MTLAAPTSARLAGGQARYRIDGGNALSGERAVVMLYQRLLRDLDEAVDALVGDDPLAAHGPLMHAQEIIEALDASLDRSAWTGATALGALYEHLTAQLVVANTRKDPHPVREARQVVAPLAEAWQQAWAETTAIVSAV